MPIAVNDGRHVLSGLLYTKVSAEIKTVPPKSHVEVTIDLEPILAEIEDFSPPSEVYATDREAKQMICTTNLLERFFREFRNRTDEIGCFASQAQAKILFYLILQREKAKHTVA